MLFRNFIFYCFVFVGLFSCEEKTQSNLKDILQEEAITNIVWSNYGGDLGANERLTITEDSIWHSYFVAANNNSFTENKYKNNKSEWLKLVHSLDFNDFKNVNNGFSVQPVDGMDEEIYIETTQRSDSLINGYNDTLNYLRISNFIKSLDRIRLETTNPN